MGGVGVVINLGLLFILVEYVHLDMNLAWIIAVLVSILNNFIWNSIFTYRDRKAASQRETAQRAMYYYLTSFLVMVFNFIVYRAGIMLGLQYLAAAFLGIVFSTFFNFLLANKLVWKNKDDAERFFSE